VSRALIMLSLLLATSAQAIRACHSARPPGAHVYWSWRQIDGRACWHAGGTLSKAALYWPAAAPRQPQTLPAPAIPLAIAPVPAVPLPTRATTSFEERWWRPR
jgi:hypothetical protein